MKSSMFLMGEILRLRLAVAGPSECKGEQVRVSTPAFGRGDERADSASVDFPERYAVESLP